MDVRRLPRRLACALLLALAGSAVAAGAALLRSIDVQTAGDGYVVDATLVAPVTPAIAWQVLTDFDNMHRFAPNVRESRVVQRDDNRVTIEQRGTVRFGPLNFPFTTERRIEMSPPSSLHSVQTRGTMQKVESVTTLLAEPAGTFIHYHVEIVPSRFTAAAFSKALLRHEIEEQFGAVVAEMMRRGP